MVTRKMYLDIIEGARSHNSTLNQIVCRTDRNTRGLRSLTTLAVRFKNREKLLLKDDKLFCSAKKDMQGKKIK